MRVRSAPGSTTIILSPDEARLLGTMLSEEVIGSAVTQGIVEGLNQGLDINDPYWGTDFTLAQAGQLASDLLVGLGSWPHAITEWNEAKGWFDKSGEQR